jgi:predicted small integral membrane protein
MLRTAKVGLIIVAALWGFIGALGNILDWNQALTSVAAVTSMSTFEGGADSWQAMASPLLSWLGALFIVSGKLATGILCTIGARQMWQVREGDLASFASAKQYALTGCAVGAIMLFGGFLVIGESWFELWRTDSPYRLALTDAFRYAGLLMLIAIFVGQSNE